MKAIATWFKQSFCFHWWSCIDTDLYDRPYRFECSKCGKKEVT